MLTTCFKCTTRTPSGNLEAHSDVALPQLYRMREAAPLDRPIFLGTWKICVTPVAVCLIQLGNISYIPASEALHFWCAARLFVATCPQPESWGPFHENCAREPGRKGEDDNYGTVSTRRAVQRYTKQCSSVEVVAPVTKLSMCASLSLA